MSEWLELGATAGVIGFVGVVVFMLCCIVALLVVGLAGWIVKKIGEMFDDHKPRNL